MWVFLFPRTNVLAPGQLDQILLAVHDRHGAVRVEAPNVAGLEPARAALVRVEVLGRLVRVLVVAERDRRAANPDLAARSRLGGWVKKVG